MSESPIAPDPVPGKPTESTTGPVSEHAEDEHGLPDEAVLRRAEEKPPLYRFFRGGMYVTYMLIVVWFVVGVILAAYQTVWGPEGEALRAQEQSVKSR